jgi:hypothetical protein
LCTKQPATRIVDASVAHRHVGRDIFAGPGAICLSAGFANGDILIGAELWVCQWRTAREVHSILTWHIRRGLVSEWPILLQDQLELRPAAKDFQEAVVVYGEEGFLEILLDECLCRYRSFFFRYALCSCQPQRARFKKAFTYSTVLG